MENLATIEDVKTSFIRRRNERKVQLDLHLRVEGGEKNEIVISFLLLNVTPKVCPSCVNLVSQNCYNYFINLCSILDLLGVSQVEELKGKSVYIISSKKSYGHALSNEEQEKWVVCKYDACDTFGESYFTKAEALSILNSLY